MKIAYIDAQNVHKGIQELGWILGRDRFFIFLREKYKIDKAILFLGYVEKYKSLYNFLKETGYEIIFKETQLLPDNTIKGNVDIDVAISVLIDIYENNLKEAYLVTGDGDYNSLVTLLKNKGLLGNVLIPNMERSSQLLRRSAGKQTHDLSLLRKKLEKKRDK